MNKEQKSNNTQENKNLALQQTGRTGSPEKEPEFDKRVGLHNSQTSGSLISELKKERDEILKGCGDEYVGLGLKCGVETSNEVYYCPICKTKIQQLKKDLKRFEKFIEDLKKGISELINYEIADSFNEEYEKDILEVLCRLENGVNDLLNKLANGKGDEK